jgi:hypothetical protein
MWKQEVIEKKVWPHLRNLSTAKSLKRLRIFGFIGRYRWRYDGKRPRHANAKSKVLPGNFIAEAIR